MPNCRFCDHANPTGIDRCQSCGAWLEQTIPTAAAQPAAEAASAADTFEAQLAAFLQRGQLIPAIKLYREHTGSGLAEAKSAVEAMAAVLQTARKNLDAEGLSPNSLEGQIIALLRARKKIEAIRIFRHMSGCGLKDSKDAVEALAVKHGINPKGAGCAGMVLLMIALAAVLLKGLL